MTTTIQNPESMALNLLIEETALIKLTFISTHGGFKFAKEKQAEEDRGIIEYCREHNLNYITFDLTNNGTQPEQPVSELRLSRRISDLKIVIDWAQARYPNSKFILLGSSQGGFTSLHNANHSDKIIALVLNCPAIKLHECFQAFLTPEQFSAWPGQDVEILGVKLSYDFYKDVERNDVSEIAKEIQKPILIFHGTADRTVPIEQVRQVARNNSNVKLIEIKDGGHRFADKLSWAEWTKQVVNFVVEVINVE